MKDFTERRYRPHAFVSSRTAIVTALFNAFLIEKSVTMTVKGRGYDARIIKTMDASRWLKELQRKSIQT